MTYHAEAHARLAMAVAGREASDYARGLVGAVGSEHRPGELIRSVRRGKVTWLNMMDRAVLVEALAGTSWETIAEALAMPEGEVRRRYESTVQLWSSPLPAGVADPNLYGDNTVGTRHDADPEGTAIAVDQWFERTRDPLEATATPVQDAVTGKI